MLAILSNLTNTPAPAAPSKYSSIAEEALKNFCPARSLAFCPGCPHRASYWAIKTALALDGRDGVLFGDIGCYGLGFMPTGFRQAKTLHAMGSGIGMASGFGILDQFGATQPALTVCGDSTFYHAAIPALINALHHKANCLMIVLDNSATAMTGFQPHPGSPADAMGFAAPVIDIEKVCSGLGAEPVVRDPFELEETVMTVYDLLQQQGTKVLILRQPCALVRARKEARRYKVTVDTAKCTGEDCGCNRLCTRVFRCPGLNWNKDLGTTSIDEAICSGCGVCAEICPAHAIVREAV